VHSCFSSKGLFAYCVEIITFFLLPSTVFTIDNGLAADECCVNHLISLNTLHLRKICVASYTQNRE